MIEIKKAVKLIKYAVCAFVLLIKQDAFAQYQIGLVPQISPDRKVYQKIGYTEVEVQYGSPYANGRKIWGGLVPYDKIWRAGANTATVISLSNYITIAEKKLDSGNYSFFIIPKQNDKWTIIFNKVSKQWGAFDYNENYDALRVEVEPKINSTSVENLTYSIAQNGYNFGKLIMSWDYLTIEVPFKTNYLFQFKKEVESRANAQPDYLRWITYLQGAEHLQDIKAHKALAKDWIQKAEELMNSSTEWDAQFYPKAYVTGHLYWVVAKIFAWENSYDKALEYVNKLKSIDGLGYYNRKGKSEQIDKYYDQWIALQNKN